jgi:hypothetical protein
MGIKLVAFDLDGTILEGGELIREELLAALRSMSERGIVCATATGRPHDFQVELFDRYGIGASSGVIRALIGDEREIFLSNGTEFEPLASWNDLVRERWINVYPVAMEMLVEAEQESARRGFPVRRLHLDEISFSRGLPSLVFDTLSDAEVIETWIEDQLAARDDLPLTTNRNVRLVQVFDRKVGKGLVLAELAKHLGIDREHVLALGDSSNDYTMLDGRFGFKCATFANAEAKLKTMVTTAHGYVATQPSGLGVVESFQSYGLIDA